MNDPNKEAVEIWAPIIGYEDSYAVSNCGRVKSITFRNNKTTIRRDRVLHPTNNGSGYLLVFLSKNGKRKNHYVHRLVANAFLIPDATRTYVNHIDFDKTNNAVFNLSWCTQKENVVFSSDRMRHPKSFCKTSNTGEKYIYYRGERFRVVVKSLGVEKTFSNIEDALTFRNGVLCNV